jgi:hypothetical protein
MGPKTTVRQNGVRVWAGRVVSRHLGSVQLHASWIRLGHCLQTPDAWLFVKTVPKIFGFTIPTKWGYRWKSNQARCWVWTTKNDNDGFDTRTGGRMESVRVRINS